MKITKKITYSFPYPEQTYEGPVPVSQQPDLEPYAGGIRFENPFSLEEQPLQALGLLDVTKPPFNADNTGVLDSTAALNEALAAAQRYQLVCYIPLGTYTVTDTLYAQQYIWWEGYPYDEYRTVPRMFPVVIMGQRNIDANGETLRPKIVLAPKTERFTYTETHRPVIDVFFGHSSENNAAPASIMNMVTGLHIVIGEGNYGAIGIRCYAAQGAAVEDCIIDAGDGWCGIWGCAGNGGSHAQNIIRGGSIGIDISKGTPGSAMSGFVFDHQRNHAIVAGAKQGVEFVGCRILTDSPRPPVVSYGGTYMFIQQGQLAMIDSTIEFDNPPEQGEIQAAVSSRESVYLRNVYVKNASHAVCNPDGTKLEANPAGWCKVEEFAHGIDSMPDHGGIYTAPVYVDGRRLDTCTYAKPVLKAEPPKNLIEKHLYHLPIWQDVLQWDVKKCHGAAGDGIEDDTDALQAAIDAGDTVFLPKGYYRITRTLKLRANTRLIGVAQNLSQIIVTQKPEGIFGQAKEPIPALDTPDIADAELILAYCGLVTARELPIVYALHWRVGGNSVLRNFTFYMDPAYRITWITKDRHHPWIIVSGNGGGRWYNFWCDITQGGEGYRILRIEGTKNPFSIYACNPEHSRSEYEMEIINASNVRIYNLKSECNTPNVLIRDSDNIAIFGSGGDASTYPGGSLYHIENSTNVIIAMMNDYRINFTGHGPGYFSGTWYPAGDWHMLTETTPEGNIITTPGWERPCLYKTGELRD